MGSEEKAGPDGPGEEAKLWAQEKPRLSLIPQGLWNMTGTTEVVPGISNLVPPASVSQWQCMGWGVTSQASLGKTAPISRGQPSQE